MTLKTLWKLLLLVAVVSLLSSSLTAFLLMRAYGTGGSFSPLAEAAATIEDYYYFADENTTDEKLIENALRGMVAGIGDGYARYFTAEEYDAMLQSDSGEYTGIGLSVGLPDGTGSRIRRVYEGTSAFEAGLRAGDVITRVNGVSTANLSLDALAALFSTNEGETDTLDMLRGEEAFTVTLLQRLVHVPRVAYELLEDGVGLVRIDEFSGEVVVEFEKALATLTENGMQKLVIDLRQNPGGGLTEVLGVADALLPKGTLIATIRSRTAREQVYKAEKDGLTLPMAVLVDGGTASASELLSGALKDNGLATVVGTQTYGKGIVQSHFRLRTNGGWVKLTTDAYYTPSDVCIQDVGIAPDVLSERPEAYANAAPEDIPHAEDTQLQAALAVLAGK